MLSARSKHPDRQPSHSFASTAELTDSGLEYYFQRPLKLAKAAFLLEQSANLGIGVAKRVFGSVIHSIIGHMDNPQLISVCSYIRQLMK